MTLTIKQDVFAVLIKNERRQGCVNSHAGCGGVVALHLPVVVPQDHDVVVVGVVKT